MPDDFELAMAGHNLFFAPHEPTAPFWCALCPNPDEEPGDSGSTN